jgi:hypothetical protein
MLNEQSRLKLDRLLALLALLFLAFVHFVTRIRAKLLPFEWTDIELYLRYAINKDLFAFTSPTVNNAFDASPAAFHVPARVLLWLGFNVSDPMQVSLLSGAIVVTNAVLVLSAVVIMSRSLGATGLFSTVAAALAITLHPLIDHGRMHSVASVMTATSQSMTANALACLTLALFARTNRLYLFAFLSGALCNLHAVYGPFTVLCVYSTLLVEVLAAPRAERFAALKPVIVGLAITILAAAPFWLWILKGQALPSFTATEGELFKFYAFHRNSTAWPMMDGIHVVLSQILVFTSALAALYAIIRSGAASVAPKRLFVVTATVGCLYFVQLIGSEFANRPGLFASLSFHRFVPFGTMVLLASIPAIASWRATRQFNDRTVLGSFALTWLILACSFGAELHPKTIWLERGLFAYAAVGLATFTVRKTWFLVFFHTQAVLLIAISSISTLLEIKYTDKAFAEAAALDLLPVVRQLYSDINKARLLMLVLITAGALGLAVLFRKKISNGATDAEAISLFQKVTIPALSLIVIAVGFFKLQNDTGSALLDPTSWLRGNKPHRAIPFIVANTKETDVIFQPFGKTLMLNGVRRQYLDWSSEWYVLYGKRGLSNLISRANVRIPCL